MQIFEINKKIKMFWFFFGITIISKGKSIKRNKSRERNDDFINNGNAETNMSLQKYHFRLGQSERIVILKKNKDLSNKTHYSKSCMIKGRSMTSQFFGVPPDITNTGLDPLPVVSSVIALVNPAL